MAHDWEAHGLEGLEEWVADARARDAAASRLRQRWLARQAEESGRMVGVLGDLSERRSRVSLVTVSGRTWHGRLDLVGQDFVAIDADNRWRVLVVLKAVFAVRATGRPAAGDRDDHADSWLVEELVRLVPDCPRVQLLTGGGAAVVGQLRSVGSDMAVVTPDAGPTGCSYVALSSLSEAVVTTSG
jgi:hypothetical protein